MIVAISPRAGWLGSVAACSGLLQSFQLPASDFCFSLLVFPAAGVAADRAAFDFAFLFLVVALLSFGGPALDGSAVPAFEIQVIVELRDAGQHAAGEDFCGINADHRAVLKPPG